MDARTALFRGLDLSLIKSALSLAAFLGALLTAIYAYRRQRVLEGDASRADAQHLADRYAKAADHLGSDQAAIRLAGVYSMARLGDDWPEERQTCLDVLCAYLRMPYDPDLPKGDPDNRAGEAQVRRSVQRVIASRMRPGGRQSWSAYDVDLRGAVLQDANFFGCHFEGHAWFGEATFLGVGCWFEHARFHNTTWFSGATFKAPAVFDRATFLGDLSFQDAVFGSDAQLRHLTVTGSAEFAGTLFQANSDFYGSTFHGDARFSGAAFEELCQFNKVSCGAFAHFTHCRFNGGLTACETSFASAAFHHAAFGDASYFNDAVFRQYCSFEYSTFTSYVNFAQARFGGVAYFVGTAFEENTNFDGCTFEATSSFESATFARGTPPP
jgi:uncharacterized protein YjbI with pentapeptide repeats